GKTPLQKSSSLHPPSSPAGASMKKSQSAASLEKTSTDRPTPKMASVTLHKPSVSATRGRDPQIPRQHSVPENLREAAVRLMSPRRCRSKSPDGVAYSPVLGDRGEKDMPETLEVRRSSRRPSLQPRQGTSRRFSALNQPSKDLGSNPVSLSATPVTTPSQKRFALHRFTEAQKDTFAKALGEIRAGRKSSCWMWFVIPTPPHVVHGVEKGSSVNRRFALRSDEEARAYLAYENDGVNLRQNYLAMMTAVRDQLRAGKSVPSLMGQFDAPKLASSVRLFERVTRGGDDQLQSVLQDIMASMASQA
ncbi:unnamed protein product, partial [Symbiodinium sp. KB8]